MRFLDQRGSDAQSGVSTPFNSAQGGCLLPTPPQVRKARALLLDPLGSKSQPDLLMGWGEVSERRVQDDLKAWAGTAG